MLINNELISSSIKEQQVCVTENDDCGSRSGVNKKRQEMYNNFFSVDSNQNKRNN